MIEIDPNLITWNAPNHEHPARQAAQLSATKVANKLKEEWIDLFAEDCVFEDPVGPSMFDPEGKGWHGRQGLHDFWETAIQSVDKFHFTINDSFANGDTCANVGVITTNVHGLIVDTELVMIYRINEAGKILSMRAHWEPERSMATARAIES